jgi:hypothetical protein
VLFPLSHCDVGLSEGDGVSGGLFIFAVIALAAAYVRHLVKPLPKNEQPTFWKAVDLHIRDAEPKRRLNT